MALIAGDRGFGRRATRQVRATLSPKKRPEGASEGAQAWIKNGPASAPSPARGLTPTERQPRS